MKNYITKIAPHPLFDGIKQEDLNPMLSCLGSFVRKYQKEETVVRTEEPVRCVGIILEGAVHMVKEDIGGNRILLTFIGKGELFGETFACGSNRSSKVTFTAAAESEILFLPFHKIMNTCTSSCVFHHQLVENMVKLICNKNVQLMDKIEATSKKTLREKILTYLLGQADQTNSNQFEIPLSRTDLAEYLCADRSAMTRELSKMREEGLIEFQKNKFHII